MKHERVIDILVTIAIVLMLVGVAYAGLELQRLRLENAALRETISAYE